MSSNTAPVSFCGWCGGALQQMKSIVENREIRNADGKSCYDLLTNTEKGTIDSIDFIFDKWNSSFCSHCLEASALYHNVSISDRSIYNIRRSNNSLGTFYNLEAYSDKVITFFDKLDDTLNCFNKFFSIPNISLLNVLNFPSSRSLNISHMVCNNCSTVYYALLDFYNNQLLRYNTLDGEHGQLKVLAQNGYRFAVCLDVQDAINRTQWAWYNLFQCRTEEINPIGFLLPLLICIVFLITFHALAQSVCRHPVHLMVYRPKRVEPTIRTQRRLLSTSSVTQDHTSLIRSYGSIGSVGETNLMNKNTVMRSFSSS
ncbi:unnamed protein product [Trichobilharzia szidati]|nr:unnamed protein product [Trichobilharzia szidati]